MSDIPLPTIGTVTVEVEQLDEFYQAATAEGQDHFSQPMTDVSTTLGSLIPNFGGGGLVEGQQFGPVYQACLFALLGFLRDVPLGLTTLGAGAAIAAAAYQKGDADSADLIAAVRGAFAPPTVNPDDVERWMAGVAEQDRRNRQEWDRNADAFADVVDQQRDEPAVDAAFDEPAGSDYFDPRGDPYRHVAGDGTDARVVVGNDNEHLGDLSLPGTDELLGENVISDADLNQPLDSFPDDVRQRVDEQRWTDSDNAERGVDPWQPDAE
jgi:hypothetical protein